MTFKIFEKKGSETWNYKTGEMLWTDSTRTLKGRGTANGGGEQIKTKNKARKGDRNLAPEA